MYVCLDQTSVWANQAKTNTDLTGEGAPVSMYTGKVRVNSSMPVPVSDSVPSDQSCFMNCPPSYWLLAETGKMPRLGLWTLQMFTVCQVSADQLMNIRFVPSLDFFFFSLNPELALVTPKRCTWKVYLQEENGNSCKIRQIFSFWRPSDK